MDIVRQPSKQSWLKKYRKYVIGALAVPMVVILANSFRIGGFQANASSLSFGHVQRGNFMVTVQGTGVLAPRDVRWIASNVSGRVESIKLKPGAEITQGDVILTLSNPELLQQAEEIQWELEAEEAQLQALEVSLASQILDQQANVLNAEMNYESARIQLEAEKELLEEGNATVSMIDFKRSQLATKQYLSRWQIEQQRLEKLKENSTAQVNAANAMLNRLRKTLARAEHQVASLTVTAPSDGVLQDMPLEPGQQVVLGTNMAKLARQDQLIAELQVPERRIGDVLVGQGVTIDTRISKVAGKVIRIDPAVVNGTVQVDVEFVAAIPAEARPDLTVDGLIETASIDNAVFVSRPIAAQNHSKTSIYKVSGDGSSAQRVRVEFGVGSNSEIQVLAGLQPGERIILSDSSSFQHLEQFNIQ